MATTRVSDRARGAHERLTLRDPFWPAQVTVGLAIVLGLVLPDKLTLGPRWLIPALEGVLLIGLAAATPHPNVRHSPIRRHMAIGLIGIVSAVNLLSLILLAHYLLQGGKAGGHELITAGVLLWVNNVLLFGLWYWEMDRGGPVRRAMEPGVLPDFRFVQMEQPEFAPSGWMPGFIDYMYTSFTNATAFSPTDTMPLTPLAKALMAVQSGAALVTVALVVARAVNILS